MINFHQNSKLIGICVFVVGVGLPITLLALNAFAFETNSGILFLATYAAFFVSCPGFWFDLDSAFLIRNAIHSSLANIENNLMVFIFWSLINGLLYWLFLLCFKHLKDRASVARMK